MTQGVFVWNIYKDKRKMRVCQANNSGLVGVFSVGCWWVESSR